MGEQLKDTFKHLFTQIIFPGAIWDWIKNGCLLMLSILGLKKSGETWNILAAGGNISLHSRILLGLCVVICALNIIALLIYLIIGIHTYRKQKAQREQLDVERAQLTAEKERMNSEAIVPTFPPLESSYIITNVEIELFFENREHITQRQTISFCVKDESLDSISHTMTWTGDGYSGSQLDKTSIQRGYQLTEAESSASIFKITVTFPEEKRVGDTGTYCIETKVTDTKHQMMPFLARLIKCPTKQLSLKITAPPGMIQSCKRMVTADSTCDFILSGPKPVNLERVGNLSYYQYKFDNPDLLRYYRLHWVFTDAVQSANSP